MHSRFTLIYFLSTFVYKIWLSMHRPIDLPCLTTIFCVKILCLWCNEYSALKLYNSELLLQTVTPSACIRGFCSALSLPLVSLSNCDIHSFEFTSKVTTQGAMLPILYWRSTTTNITNLVSSHHHSVHF